MNKDFNHSYWELKHYFKTYDLIIVGAGLIGMSSAISYQHKNKKAKILIIDSGIIPNGASTKNAGFACFGSISEILDDLKTTDEASVFGTIKMRIEGLNLLRKRLGDKNIGYKNNGGYELFQAKKSYEKCASSLPNINKKLKSIVNAENCFRIEKENKFGFKKIKGILFTKHEGQIETGLMMKNLHHLCLKNNIEVLWNCKIDSFLQLNNGVELISNIGLFKTEKLLIATNGFAKNLIPNIDVKPARAQVLVTKKIEGLKIKGNFHFDEGYYYFRNIDNRILFGGGRNLDFEKETTDKFELNKKIQNQLEKHLREIILPNTKFEIAHRWTGIMGVGSEKKPIIKNISKDITIAVRMGGMGVAIGSKVGEMAAKKIMKG